jgi:hypothetical protein
MISRIATALAALAFAASGALAQDKYPSKPVKIIVPYPAGQATDIAARIVGEALGREWGQAVVIENIGGGAAIPGLVTARGAAPDGYTLLMGTSAALVVNPAIMDKIPYDPFNDFTMIGPVFRNPLIIVANEKAPYRTLKDLVDAAKKEPGKLNWGYPGAGTTQHLTGELFKQVAGVDIQGVMYKGSAQAVQDLLGDQIQLSVDGIGRTCRTSRRASSARSPRPAPRAPAAARRADRRRAGLSRLLRRGLGRRRRDQGRAGRDRHEDLRRPAQGDERSRRAAEAHDRGPHGRQHAARRVDRVRQEDRRHLGRGGEEEQHQDAMIVARRASRRWPGPIMSPSRVSERDASGEKAAIFAEMKRLGGVPMVALIFRHLATLPGGIEWAWGVLEPAWRQGHLQEAAWRIARSAPMDPIAAIPRAALAPWASMPRPLPGSTRCCRPTTARTRRTCSRCSACCAASREAPRPRRSRRAHGSLRRLPGRLRR